MTTRDRVRWLSAWSLLLAAACGSLGGAEGGANVRVSVSKLGSSDVQRVALSVTGPGIAEPLVHELAQVEGRWQGTILKIPAGADRVFRAEARGAADAVLFAGQASGVTIAPNGLALVSLRLQQASPPTPFQNHVPIIESLVASAGVVPPGGTVALAVTAADADGEPLAITWSAPAGSFGSAAAASTTFTAPATEGPVPLTVVVSDPKAGVVSASLTLLVSASAATGGAGVEVTFNTWPVITGLSATPGRVPPGQSSVLALTVFDADGDALSYAWSDGGCGGTYAGAAVEDPSWTAPTAAPPIGTCTLVVSVQDGAGGSTMGALTLPVGSGPLVNSPPVFTALFQSARTVGPGGTVLFRAVAVDPEGQALAFDWSASAGTLGAPVPTSGASQVSWTAPLSGCSHRVTARVTDAAGTASAYVFPVSSCPTCGNGSLEAGEQCDGAAFGRASCTTLGFLRGTLACGPSCAFNTIGCSNIPAEACGNDADDDGDGAIDCWDSDCQADARCTGRGVPYLVKDLAPNVNPGSSPNQFTFLAGSLYFQAGDAATGTELWRTDGTLAGTMLVKDLNPGPGSSYPYPLVVFDGALYFGASDGTSGYELWKSDGTAAGTVRVKDLNPGTASSSPSQLTVVGSTLFFSAATPANGRELWRSDGTEAGTVLVRDLVPGTADASPSYFVAHGGVLYFAANVSGYGTELCRSDGTSAGTGLVKDLRPGTAASWPSDLRSVGGRLLFAADDGATGSELWSSDGTEAGTVLVKDLLPGTGAGYSKGFATIGGTLYFCGNDGAGAGYELWKSDGTAAGTMLVKDIYPGAGNACGSATGVVAGGRLYIVANEGTGAYKLWKSDGTALGTVRVSDVGVPIANSGIITTVGTSVVFRGDDGTRGSELWKTDGTAAGTVMLKDMVPGIVGSSPNYLVALGGTVYFSAEDGVNGPELWKTSGTPETTVMVKNINGVVGSPNGAAGLTATTSGGRYFFSQRGRAGAPAELWVSDGSGAGTTRLLGVAAEPSRTVHIGTMANVSGTVFFAVSQVDTSFASCSGELWKTDGTIAGTVRVAGGFAGGFGCPEGPITRAVGANGTLFFVADNGVDGSELWKSDGTLAGTVMLRDINPGSSGSGIYWMLDVNGTLCFAANDETHGLELWRSDGTAAGTVLVKDLEPGSAGSNARPQVAVGSTLYFVAREANTGYELWKTDGTDAGTALVKDLNPGSAGSDPMELTVIGTTLYFSANDGSSGYELWKSDGTAAGTVRVRDILPGPSSSGPSGFAVLGGKLLFSATDGVSGTEPWVSDGTAAGTVMLRDLYPGPVTPGAYRFVAVGGAAYFGADDGATGRELWKTDGTAAGTVRVADLVPGSPGSSPDAMATAGSRLFFWATTPDTGWELWALQP
ncbi:MAG: hypothetical protein IT371_03980 [Deltaproteobacteria bacterium]|nr:hypothetical protein [Deltaproteobacteria bacterium]